MTSEEGYEEAQRRIRLMEQTGALELDLSGLILNRFPRELGRLAKLQSLSLCSMTRRIVAHSPFSCVQSSGLFFWHFLNHCPYAGHSSRALTILVPSFSLFLMNREISQGLRGMCRVIYRMAAILIVIGTLSLARGADDHAVSSGVKYELIGSYSVDRLNQILTSELKEFSAYPTSYPPAHYAVKLYRVTYPSVIPEQYNRPTTASGLLAVPESGLDTMPVVSYQHGTVFSKTEVPSHPDESMETRLMLAQFAGQGYVMVAAEVAADYFGKGQSQEKDSYLVKASTQQACLDMRYGVRHPGGQRGTQDSSGTAVS